MTSLIAPGDMAAITRDIGALQTWQAGLEHLNVALVYGGVSAEDRLYIAESPTEQLSVTALAESLTAIGAQFRILDPCDTGFVRDLLDFDVVLSNLHGPYGEDGRLQGLLDYLRTPFCGSGVAASAVAADKVLCKQVMTALKVPTPAWQIWTHGPVPRWNGRPVMVKPPMGGSSVGMSLVGDETAFAPALHHARTTDPSSPVLIEEYITGLPVTVGLLQLPSGLLVFPPVATEVRDAEFYDEASKLDADARGTVSVIAAELPAAVQESLLSHTRALWEGLGCRGAARIDFMITDDRVYALEVNTTPGMSRGSNYVVGASLCGLTHADVVLAMLHEALTRPTYDVPLPIPVLHTSTPVREPAV